ncbi:MAG: TonB-dependent receptor plug, partial [Acidobacteria bacterium]|nr:TonB-dependent receptor plug [Acidobacteriota bacterium]
GVRRDDLLLVDGARINRDELSRAAVDEAIDETTILNGGISAEYGRFDGGVIATITKSGSNELHGSLRADFDNDRHPRNVFEGTLGGRAIEDKLWLFGAARAASDDRRFQAKANGLLTPNQTLVASYFNSEDARDFLSGQYTATLPHDVTIEALATRDDNGDDTLNAKAHYVIATHELVAGFDKHALFINDRWSFTPRWSFNLGVRRDENTNTLSPRLGVIRELGEDGTQRVTVSYGRYALSNGTEIDELTAGYGKQLGNEGYIRADAIHRDDYDALLLQGTYRLVGHLTLGGNYAWSSLVDQRNRANAWAQFDMPFKDGELNVALLDQYDNRKNNAGITIGYAIPIRDITTFAKADLLNGEARIAIGARF